jgi:nicotinic acid mononucleotide adenylyltransferase
MNQARYFPLKKSGLTGLDRGEASPVSAVLRSGRRVDLAKVTPIGISSTEIRRCAKKGASIKYLLPAEVESYIISNNLYRGEELNRRGSW